LLALTSVVALTALLFIAIQVPIERTPLHSGQSLVLGGALGNTLDRARFQGCGPLQQPPPEALGDVLGDLAAE